MGEFMNAVLFMVVCRRFRTNGFQEFYIWKNRSAGAIRKEYWLLLHNGPEYFEGFGAAARCLSSSEDTHGAGKTPSPKELTG